MQDVIPLLNGFQSTLPVWGATRCKRNLQGSETFQSTLPVWGATTNRNFIGIELDISIHAPRVGSDSL